MIYFKSFLAGLAATIVAELLILAAGIAALVIMASSQPNNSETGIGWDPVSFARTAPGWTILVFAFIIGFWWQYRRHVVR